MKVSTDVLAVLSSAATDGRCLILQGQLERRLYERTNKVLEAAGGQWTRKLKAHVFESDAAERVDQIIVTGRVDLPKDEFNYFPTPPELAAQLVRWADVRPGMRVLEPSAGRAAIASELRAAGAVVDCYELMPVNAEHLASLGFRVQHCDFLQVPPVPSFQRAVMNPPFAKQADIRHVTHALGFLAPGGRLVSVMSAGVAFRTDRRAMAFRALVEERGGSIQELPEGSFRPSGTDVNTVVVTIPTLH